MPAVFGQRTIDVHVDTDGNPDNDAIFVFAGHGDDRMKKAIDKYMKGRVKAAATRGRRGGAAAESAVEGNNEALIEFFGEACVNVKNAVFEDSDGKLKPLSNQVRDWQDRVDPFFKIAAAGWVVNRPAYGNQTEAEVVGN